jgi:hypothetical protein
MDLGLPSLNSGMPNLNLTPGAQPSDANSSQPSNADTPGNYAGKRYARSQPGGASSSGSGDPSGGDPDADASADPSQSSNSAVSNFGNRPKKSGGSQGHRRFAEQSQTLVSITRPIKLECYADRLVLVSDDGDPANNKVIPLSGFVRDSIDRLETDIHERIGSWGMAGRGMQWHPIVVVKVAPDAAERFAAVQRMLKGDGLEVRDKNAPTKNPPAP